MELQSLKKQTPVTHYIPLKSESDPSLLSCLFFTWIHPMLSKGFTSKLEPKDAFPLPNEEKIKDDPVSHMLQTHSLFTTLILINSKRFILILILSTLALILEFSTPIYLQLLIQYIEQEEKPLGYGVGLASAFIITSFTYPLIATQKNFKNDFLGIKTRNLLLNYVYNKSINSAILPDSSGVNILQVDVPKVQEFISYIAGTSLIPFQMAASVYIVYQQVGNAVWVAVGVICVAMVINFLGRRICIKLDQQLMILRDTRIEQSTQMLTEMKMIKAYAWENYFLDKIAQTRKLEIGKQRLFFVFHSFNRFYYWALPSIAIAAVFVYYSMIMEEEITTEKIFVTLSALSLLQSPIIMFPIMCSALFKMIVSLKRINKLVAAKPYQSIQESEKISLKNCSFAYEDKQVLKNISLEIEPGEFISIIGPVSSGKSSLLLSMLGELTLNSGSLKVNPSLAYAPSLDSWLLNASIKDNILMGLDFKEDFYWQVIDACCLTSDLSSLPSSDNTEIGERGINLSGGQKARVCLARAVYSEKEVYLLDDPLSSVDNHVAEHIFNKCFLQLLRGKTRILVTHRLEFLANVDRVVELDGGKIVKVSHGEVVIGKSEHKESGNNKEEGPKDKLIVDEEKEEGEVSAKVYSQYFKYSGGYLWVSLAFIALILWTAVKMAADMTLKDWSKHPSEVKDFLTPYLVLRIGSNVFMLLNSLVLNVILSNSQ